MSDKLLNLSVRRAFSAFTLLEVVIAISILAMGMVGIMMMSNSAHRRVARAMDKWESQHMLAQACEYYLLVGPEERINKDFFPVSDFDATCDLVEPENLPADFEFELSGWKLATFVIRVTNNYNNFLVAEAKVDKIIQYEGATE